MEYMKVRAKGVITKDWVKGHYVPGIRNNSFVVNVISEISQDVTTDNVLLQVRGYEVDTDTICRHIGLNDENGVEVYDNDVVDLTVFDKDGYDWHYICLVEIDEFGGVWFKDIKNEDNVWSLSTDIIEEADLLVLGNKFDNPEFWRYKYVSKSKTKR